MLHRRALSKPAPLVWDDRPCHGKAFSPKRVCLLFLSVLAAGSCLAAAFVEVVQEVGQILFHYATANPAHTLSEVPEKFLSLGEVAEDMPVHFYPMKGADERKSGFVPWVGPLDISQPSWGFEQDKPSPNAQIYNNPLIDVDGNIYIAVRSNRLYSLAPNGALRWSMMAGVTPNWTIRLMPKISSPVLVGRYIYIADGSAYLLKIKKDTGEVKWRMRYTWQDEGDGHLKGLTYHNGTLLTHGWCSEMLSKLCKFTITALDAVDGHVLWKILDSGDTPADPRQVIWEDFVVMIFDHAELRCWDLRTGERKWSIFAKESQQEDVVVKSGPIAAGDDGVLYASVLEQQKLKDWKIDSTIYLAVDIRTGRVLWERKFPRKSAATRSAVYRAGGRTLVSAQLGVHAPALWEGQQVSEWSNYYREMIWIRKNRSINDLKESELMLSGSVHALDGLTGEIAWTFQPEDVKMLHNAGSDLQEGVCWIDHWSEPTVGGDGTFYVGRMDGTLYALDGATGQVRSTYAMQSGILASPAVAPGMLVVSACQWTAVFKTQRNASVAPGRVQRPWVYRPYDVRGALWRKFYPTKHGVKPDPRVSVFANLVVNGTVRDGVLVESAGVDWVNGFYVRRKFAQVNGRMTFFKNGTDGSMPAKIFHTPSRQWCIGEGSQSARAFYCSDVPLPNRWKK